MYVHTYIKWNLRKVLLQTLSSLKVRGKRFTSSSNQAFLPKNMYLLTRVETLDVSSGNIYASLHSTIEKRTLFPPEETASLARSFFLNRRTLNCLIRGAPHDGPPRPALISWRFFSILIVGRTRPRRTKETTGGEGGSCECHTCCPNAFPDKLTSDLDALRGRAPDVPPPTLVL